METSSAKDRDMNVVNAPLQTQVPAPLPPPVLSTMTVDGKRRWLEPRVSRGRFLTARRWAAYALILIFTAIPYVQMNGKPLILLDIVARRFTFFGKTFLPTDTLLLALLVVSIFLTIFLITALFGRIWCGWACPQTVYMEFVYRPIERFFIGAPGKKKNSMQSSGLGRMLMYGAFLLVSMFLAHTFLAYFVGVARLAEWVGRSPFDHPTPFIVMLVVTGLMMFDFTYFREQTCLVACPYGRFQSVMLDRNSLIISYDRVRGEPRGKARRRPESAIALPQLKLGDCVDCQMCVTTCPTGIDIRDGLQMECIGCAQCIDACDTVMEKLGRPLGLIRYSSQSAMEGAKPRMLRTRVIIYVAVLSVLATAFLLVLSTKSGTDFTVIRGLGRPFTEMPGGVIANPVRVKVVNRTEQPQEYTFDAVTATEKGVRCELRLEEPSFTLEPGETKSVPGFVEAPAAVFHGGYVEIRVRVLDKGVLAGSSVFRMMGPGNTHVIPGNAQPEPSGAEGDHT